MNIMFWAILIVMLLVAIGVLVYPLLKVRENDSLAYKDSNLKINDDKINELDLDLKEGRIDQTFYKLAREELDKELLIDIPVESQQTAALHYTNTAKRRPAMALVVSVFIPMVALLLYLDLGMHDVSDETVVAGQQTEKQPSVEEMATKLEAHIEKNGGTAEEWTMLGRAHKHLGRHKLAANAFAVALEQDPDNAQLMLERAEMLALNNNRTFTDEATQLVEKAYELEPDNANVLWFAGVSAYQAGKYRLAIDRLLLLLPSAQGEEEVMRSVIGIVAKSREQLIAAGEKIPELETLLAIKENSAALAPATEKVESSAESAATSLRVMVDINAEARGRFEADDLVFVYAKAKQGPRMPLAAQRITLADLPATVVLDDSMAMVAGMNLSAFDDLVVSARVTKSGAAIAQSGDYVGSIDVRPQAATVDIDVVIDTLIP
jgi:cytochrome c-type biogenesis protein CcmH